MAKWTNNKARRARSGLAVAVIVATGLLASGCSTTSDGQVAAAATDASTTTPLSRSAPAAVTSTTAPGRPVNLIGTMALAPDKGKAGTPVRVSGSGLPPDAALRVMWTTNECRWVLKGDQREEYHGRTCDPKELEVGTATTSATGQLAATFVAPEGFGFGHDVLLVDHDGAVRNRALFDMAIDASITPDSGPVGTPITVTVTGMGVEALENNRQILYDNSYTGWLSAITTNGTAKAVIPATGRPGRHIIQVARGAFTFPYLNPAQSPRPDIPVFEFPFTVTSGAAVQPAAVATQSPVAKPAKPAAAPDATAPSLVADTASGPVGTKVKLTGEHFPGGTDVKLQWFRIVGNRVGGQGWEERSVELSTVKSGRDGRFEATITIPNDVGGSHRIEATAGNASPARTSVTVTPAAFPLSVASGPVGTPFTVHVNGVGWTETANIYTVVYDNRYIGYACGFNSQGDVRIPLTATGEPGWHYVDLYPAIYKGQEQGGQQSFRIPQLTFADDHPGEDLPAFHFAFEITG